MVMWSNLMLEHAESKTQHFLQTVDADLLKSKRHGAQAGFPLLFVFVVSLVSLYLGDPARSRILLLNDVDLSRRDYSLKFRVLRLWRQPVYNNPAETYSIEMIVVDEQGTTIQASVLRRWFQRFEALLNETGCYFLVKPTIGRNDSKYKYVPNINKIGLYADSFLYRCTDFSGPVYGFNFTSFDPIVAQTIPKNSPVDVIGFVADLGGMKKIKTSKGKDTYKVNVLIQDLNMKKIYLSLWDSYADEILAAWDNRGEVGIIVVILQFGTLQYFQNFGYVNNAFNVSKLFINSELPEIEDFKKRLLQNAAISDCSAESSKLNGIYLSQYDEFVANTEFNNIAEVNISKVKKIVIVATIELIPVEIPWFYMSCKTCNKKLSKFADDIDISELNVEDKEVMYSCRSDSCKPTAEPGVQRIKIPLTVQDSTGFLSLSLFDREATNLVNKSSAELIENYLSGKDEGLYPDEFKQLIGKKFAFMIEISQFNVDKKVWVFKVLKLTNNSDIIAELEKKANNYEAGNSQSLSNTLSEMPSEATVNLKAVNSETLSNTSSELPSLNTVNLKESLEIADDNVTPMSKIEDANPTRQNVDQEKYKRKSKNPDFKRTLVEEFEDNTGSSGTKAATAGKIPLLIPKIEK